MSDPLLIEKREQGVLRLFALDMAPAEARFLRDTPGAAAQALGVPEARQELIEVFDIADLAEVGLKGYLVEGCGIDPAVIEATEGLDGLSGWMMALPSQAVTTRPVTLRPNSKLSPVASFGEPRVDWSARPVSKENVSVQREPGPSPRAARARARTIGGSIFAVVMVVVVVLVWVALG